MEMVGDNSMCFEIECLALVNVMCLITELKLERTRVRLT